MDTAVALAELQTVMKDLSTKDPCPMPTPFSQISALVWNGTSGKHHVVMTTSSNESLESFIKEVSMYHILMGWVLGRHQGEMIRSMQKLWPEMVFPED